MQFGQLRRREFITLIGGAAAVWPISARAQELGRVYRVGVVNPVPRDTSSWRAFFDELQRNGFVEGQNLLTIPGGFGVPASQINKVAAEMVKAAPDAIIAGPDPELRALQALTRTIPIVGMTEDMVAAGLVASLRHPGGNTTGISLLSEELDGKRGDVLFEAVTGLHRMAALADFNTTPERHLAALRESALARGFELSAFGVKKPEEIPAAINDAKASGVQGLNFLATPIFFVNRRIVVEQVAAVGLPAIYQWPEMAEEGGLMAYGSSISEISRHRARMLVKILRGADPANTPVEQPTRFQLVINLKTAKALDLTIPPTLLATADEVIE